MRRAYPDGVWLVGLSALRNPALLDDTVATALGLRGPWPSDARGVLTEYLAQRSALLVLDNCERPEELAESAAAAEISLDDDLRKAIDEVLDPVVERAPTKIDIVPERT